jgi:hypothetical protein
MFDTQFKAWTKFKGMNVNAWCVADGDTENNILYFGDYDGYINSYPSGGYHDGEVATSPIIGFYQTKWFKYPEHLGDKYWRLLKTYVFSETTDNTYLSINCKSDFEESGKLVNLGLSNTGDLWDTAIWDKAIWYGSNLMVGRTEVNKGKNMFQLNFENDIVDQGFSILGFDIFIEPADKV